MQTPAEMIHYGMTKTAQLAVARGLAETTAGTGVTVNAVLPSTIDTPANRAEMPDADFSRILKIRDRVTAFGPVRGD